MTAVAFSLSRNARQNGVSCPNRRHPFLARICNPQFRDIMVKLLTVSEQVLHATRKREKSNDSNNNTIWQPSPQCCHRYRRRLWAFVAFAVLVMFYVVMIEICVDKRNRRRSLSSSSSMLQINVALLTSCVRLVSHIVVVVVVVAFVVVVFLVIVRRHVDPHSM